MTTMQAINIFDSIPHVAPPRLMPLVAFSREQPAWTHYASPEPALPGDVEPLPGTVGGEFVKADPWSPDMQRYWARRFPKPEVHSKLLAPSHVTWGSMRRGRNMLVVTYLRDQMAEEALIAERTAFVAEALETRPDGIDEPGWRELLNQALRATPQVVDVAAELERLAAAAGLSWRAEAATPAAGSQNDASEAPGVGTVAPELMAATCPQCGSDTGDPGHACTMADGPPAAEAG